MTPNAVCLVLHSPVFGVIIYRCYIVPDRDAYQVNIYIVMVKYRITAILNLFLKVLYFASYFCFTFIKLIATH